MTQAQRETNTSSDVDGARDEAPVGKPVYRFTAENTVREMLVAAEALEKAGHRPQFKFVRSYNEAIEAIDVHVDSPEMAVTS